MRFRKSFLNKKIKKAALLLAFCVFGAALVFGGVRIFAEILGDDVRVNEDEDLTYYISVNSDGIDYTGAESSDSLVVEEVSSITVVKDVIPDGLSFVDFVSSPDGTFGAVQRDDKVTACSGKVIDDTNEESVDSGVWNNETNEYTYHGLHYDANTRTVSFKTKGIGAGCELTIGVITHTPTLAENEFRKDFYNTASFVDESLTDKSNTVHAYIQKAGSVSPGEYTVSYRYDGEVPDNAPALPTTQYFDDAYAEFTVADVPSIDGYGFTGWLWDPPNSYSTGISSSSFSDGHLFGFSVEFYGSFGKLSEPSPQPDESYYSISYRYDNRVPAGAPALPAMQWHLKDDVIVAADKPNVECYDFNGWYWVPPGAPTSNYVIDPIPTLFQSKMPGQNIVLYGSFTYTCESEEPEPDSTPEKYNVSYAIDGEKPESFDLPASRNYLEGASVELDSTKEGENFDGYDFSGWDTESEEIEVDSSLYFTMPKRNVVLRGSFDREEYTVSYEFSSDTKPENYESLLPATESYFAGDNVTAAAVPVADGYTFSGWYADPSFEMPAKNVVIYGEWIKDKQEFTPEISISIKNPENEYHIDDTVEFEVVVKNTTDFDMVDVWLEELLDGAVFVPGEGYEVTEQSFARIANIPANGEAHVDAQFAVTKNMTKLYTNTVEMIAGSSANEDYALSEDWDSKASVDFATAVVEDLPIDEDTEVPEEKESPKTFDGVLKFVISGGIISGGLCVAAIVLKKNRRGAYRYAFSAVIVMVAGFAVVLVNGGGSFADSLVEKPSLDIVSSKANYANNDAGAWKVTESGSWTGVGEAMLSVELNTKRISDLNNKDVILILDNSVWTASAINATQVDDEDDLTAMQLMKNGANEFVEQLLDKDNSRVMILQTWGNDSFDFTDDINIAKERINDISSSIYSNNGSYAESYRKLIGFLDDYEHDDSRSLNIIFVSDDHLANNNDIALYRMVKSKAPYASVAGIGFGIKEILHERYVSSASASENGIARYWYGVDGNARPIGNYTIAVQGLEYITDYYEDPYLDEYYAALVRASDTSQAYDNFDISVNINMDEFDVKAIYGDNGDFEINGSSIIWKNDNGGIVSGAKYKIGVLLSAKNTNVEKHKLYRLTNGISVGSDARDIESESIQSNENIVLMNGFELGFDMNNPNTCSLGNNQGGIYWAFQKVVLDDSANCEGWNFDSFRDPDDGTIYGAKLNRMPAKDISLKATWRKASVVIRMEGEVYSVAPAVLKPGADFNKTLYAMGSGNNGAPYSDILLKADACPKDIIDDDHRISADDSPTNVYAWVVMDSAYRYIRPDTGEGEYYYSNPTYYCTDADEIYLNKNSDYLFGERSYYFDENGQYVADYKASRYRIVDEDVKNWNASNIESLNYAFSGTYLQRQSFEYIKNWKMPNLKDVEEVFSHTQFSGDKLSLDWGVSNLENIKYMFRYSNLLDVFDLNSWDVASLENMDLAFSDIRAKDMSAVSSWDVSNVKSMKNTFEYASGSNNALSLDGLEEWNVSNVEDMEGLFHYAHPENLDALAGWDVSSVTNMKGIFSNARIPDTEGLSDWDTSSVTTLSGAFSGVMNDSYGAISVSGLSGWDTSHVTDMSSIFANAQIENLSPLIDWQTSNVVDLSRAFYSSSMVSLSGLENWKTSSVTNLNSTFYNNPQLTDISALANWDVSSVEDLSYTFGVIMTDDLAALADWDVSNVKKMQYTFCGKGNYSSGCMGTASYESGAYDGGSSSVNDLSGVENWDVSSVEDMTGIFMGSVIADLQPVKEWDVSSVEKLDYAFSAMNALSLSGIEDWDVSNVASMKGIFKSSLFSNLTGLERWNVPSVETLDEAFADMSNLVSIEALSGWRTPSLKSMEYLLKDHKKLVSLNGLENWDVSNVRYLLGTFRAYSRYNENQYTDWSRYCTSALVDISALSNWDVSNVTSIANAFSCNSRLSSLSALRNWNTKKIVSYYMAFEGDSAITNLDGLQDWGVDVEADHIHFGRTFMNMTSLSDISALSGWNGDISNAWSMFRNDSLIRDLTPLNNMTMDPAQSARANAFDGIPTSVARPIWY